MTLVREIGYSSSPLDAAHSAHKHNLHQLLFITRGELGIEIAGARVECRAPSVVFIGNLEPHLIAYSSPDYARYIISIDPYEAEKQLKPSYLCSVFTNHRAGFSHVLSVSEIEGEVESLIRMLERATAKEGVQLALSALLYRLSEHSPEHFSKGEFGSAEAIVASVRAEIEKNFKSKLSLDALAASHHVSRYYLAHIFTRISGHSLKEHLMSSRISYACQLLSETDETVAEIAERSGFGDLSNFSRSFKERIFLSPSEYRVKSRENQIVVSEME